MRMKKRIIGVILALSIFSNLYTTFPLTVNAATSGTCGDNLTWIIDQEGTLTISGTGAMYDWGRDSDAPWRLSRSSINNVVIINGVTNIGEYAFESDYPNLENITIPSSVTKIGRRAFGGCENLENVYITDLEVWCNYVFDDWAANPLFYAENIYLNNKLLTELVIPNTIKQINKYSFSGCKSITSIIIPNGVVSIGDYAFDSCDNLISVSLPESVTFIGQRAFSFCNNLKNISIPNDVTNIGGAAFCYCKSLISINIPDKVTNIGRDAFLMCESLENIVVHENNATYSSTDGVLFNKDKTLLITYPGGKSDTEYIVPNKVTTVGISSFNGCKALNAVTIPQNVAGIYRDAFDHCDNLANINVDKNNLEYSSIDGVLCNKDKSTLIIYPVGKTDGEYIIPESVINIGSMAFNGCDKLVSITIPDNVVSIGWAAFNGCGSLTNVYITDMTVWCNYTFEHFSDNPLYHAENLYLNNELITELVIPDGVEKINKYVFSGWDNLTSVTIPSSVKSIGAGSFNECKNLERVYITDLEAWCNCTFDNMRSNPLYHAENLYLNNKLVTELVIPNGVEKINKYAFVHCDSLTSVIIPDSVTSIGDYAFDGCGHYPTLPGGAGSLSGEVFSGEGLKEITFSDSIITIGRSAFNVCNSLKSVHYKGTEADWTSITINSGNTPLKNATINYVACTKTSISDSGKIFTITPKNIENGKTIILALYENGKFIEMQYAIYEGSDISFTTTKTYTEVKVMVWNDLTKLKPVCDVEIVN